MSARRAEQLSIFAILAAALLLRTWGLQQNGWGAEYYSAAVRSMAARAAASTVLVSAQLINAGDTVAGCVRRILRNRHRSGNQNYEYY